MCIFRKHVTCVMCFDVCYINKSYNGKIKNYDKINQRVLHKIDFLPEICYNIKE